MSTRRDEEEWIWGNNNRGGGGAPNKQGANLRLALHNNNTMHQTDSPSHYNQYSAAPRVVHDEAVYETRRAPPSSTAVLNSPPKFMSSLRDMHGSLTHRDKEEKALREAEYQAAFRVLF